MSEGGPSERDLARRSHSLRALEQVYYVVAGLAFTKTLEAILTVPAEKRTFQLALFVLFLTIAIRFVHGAATHFGLHNNSTSGASFSGQFERVQPLLDFLSFGVQAGMFVVLSTRLSQPASFVHWLAALLVWDSIWIGITLAFDQEVKGNPPERRTMWQWLVGNGVVAVPVLVVTYDWFFTVQDTVQFWAYIVVGATALLLDYWLNRAFYLGPSPRPQSQVQQETSVTKRGSLVVLESPYAGNVAAHVAYAKRCLLDSLRRGEAPIASHLLFTQRGVLLDSDTASREQGLEAGHAWISAASTLAVYADHGVSGGMVAGIRRALKNEIPIEFRSLDGSISREQLSALQTTYQGATESE